MFEHLVQDVSSRTGLGSVAANDLLRAVVARLLHNPQGGFAPLLATIREGGKGDVIAQWLGDDPKAGAISPDEAEAMLGADWVDETSRALGISRDEVRIGSAVALPSVAHDLTPGGMVPAADELERGYAGWAGGRVSVNEAPIAGFPSDPAVRAATRVDMELERPAPSIVAKAFDGIGTLLPWFALFVALPILSVVTCNMYPAGHAEHETQAGGAHGAPHESGVTHEEPGANPTDAPAREEGVPGGATHREAGPGTEGVATPEGNVEGASPEAGNAAVGNTASDPTSPAGETPPAGNAPADAPESPSSVSNASASNTP